MRVTDRHRRFAQGLKAARRRTRLYGPFEIGDIHDSRGILISRSISLGIALVLVGALFYALLKFFQMVQLRRLDVASLWFVPVAIVAAVAVLLLKVVRPFVRDIRTKHSRD